MSMEMPRINDCTARDCSYNRTLTCHTPAITVGKQEKQICVTYLKSELPGGDDSVIAGIVACKIYMCLHNRDLVCAAESLQVRLKEGHPVCQTYKNRYK